MQLEASQAATGGMEKKQVADFFAWFILVFVGIIVVELMLDKKETNRRKKYFQATSYYTPSSEVFANDESGEVMQ
jgi:hypothetical protein